jgi:hypothetical protein
MDTDVIPLRDVKLLRESGFKNIIGIEERVAGEQRFCYGAAGEHSAEYLQVRAAPEVR